MIGLDGYLILINNMDIANINKNYENKIEMQGKFLDLKIH